MRRITITIILAAFLGMIANAQTGIIKGKITDGNDNKAVSGATVSLLLQADSSNVKTLLTDSTGRFQIQNLSVDSFIIKISTIGYQEYLSLIKLRNMERDLGTIKLVKKGKDLAVVTIISKAPPVVQKGDTSQFSASQYKVNPDATTEDLIKKMPGITVDKDGTVTAQGEQVKKVTIDGKDFLVMMLLQH